MTGKARTLLQGDDGPAQVGNDLPIGYDLGLDLAARRLLLALVEGGA